jgi:predicted acetyltransferase
MEIEDFECSPRYPLVVAFTAPLYKQFGFSLYVVYHDSDFEGVTGSFDVFCTAESRDGKTIKNVDQKKISISSKTKNLFQVLQKVIKQAVDFASK